MPWLHKVGNGILWKCLGLWDHRWRSWSIILTPRNWGEEVGTTQQHTRERQLQAKLCSAARIRTASSSSSYTPISAKHYHPPTCLSPKRFNHEFCISFSSHLITTPGQVYPFYFSWTNLLWLITITSSPGHSCICLGLGGTKRPPSPSSEPPPFGFPAITRVIFLKHKSDHVWAPHQPWDEDQVLCFQQSGFQRLDQCFSMWTTWNATVQDACLKGSFLGPIHIGPTEADPWWGQRPRTLSFKGITLEKFYMTFDKTLLEI